MVIENNAVDWAMFTAPNEEWTKDTVSAYCDLHETDEIYAYPIVQEKHNVNAILDDINEKLKTNKPLTIPGIFIL